MAEIVSNEIRFPLKVYYIDNKGNIELKAEFNNIEDLGLYLEFFDSDINQHWIITDREHHKIKIKVDSLEVIFLEIIQDIFDVDEYDLRKQCNKTKNKYNIFKWFRKWLDGFRYRL